MGKHRTETKKKRSLTGSLVAASLVAAIALTGDAVSYLYTPEVSEAQRDLEVPLETPQIVRINQVNEIVQQDLPVTLAKVYEAARQVDPEFTEVLVIEYFKVYPLTSTAELECREGYEPRDAVVVDAAGAVTAEPLCYKKEMQVEQAVEPSSFTSSVDIKNYREDARDRGWGNGWPSSRDGITTVTTEISGSRVQVDSRIADLVKLLLDETEKRGYLIDPGDVSSYSNRPIAGTNTASNHSWGLAVDLNVSRNPQTGRLVTDMPDWMPQLWNAYGFAWGGHYGSGTLKDAMHYEFMGTPADAVELTRAARNDFFPPEPVLITEPGLLEPVGDLLEGVGGLLGNGN